MKTIKKSLIIFAIASVCVFLLTFVTADNDLSFKERFLSSITFGAFATLAFFVYSTPKKSNKNNKLSSSKKQNHVNKLQCFYIFEGDLGRTLLWRIENNKIYRNTKTIPEYQIDGNKIYRVGGGSFKYRIENNRIYEGLSTKAKYKIAGDKIYEGEFGTKPVFRISTKR